jgi:hypothetical protein
MFWSKKEDEEGLPDLPSSPAIASGRRSDYDRLPFSTEEEEIHSLPSFPDSPTDKGFSQSAIKDAVTEEEEMPELPEFGDEEMEDLPDIKPSPPPQMEEWKPRPPPQMEEWKPRPSPPQEWKPKSLPVTRSPRHIREEVMRQDMENSRLPDRPIFVRLDKFKTARNSLEVVKQKVDEIEELLKTIRDVKRKEDEELSAWEGEMESVKTRINHVTNELFDKFYTQ